MTMYELTFEASRHFAGDPSALEANINTITHKLSTPYANTQAPLVWIIRGAVKYFDSLGSDFLGEGNASGVPSADADHFANNLYRLSNSLNYLSQLWKITYKRSENFNFLLDIRTLIVHSGEAITELKWASQENYKDNQLWRIIKNTRESSISFASSHKDAEYKIVVSSDKHDNGSKYHLAMGDYDFQNENQKDTSVYISSEQVRDTVLCNIEDFERAALSKPQIHNKGNGINNLKKYAENRQNDELDVDAIYNIIKDRTRGGVSEENNTVDWPGFGLKRLKGYTEARCNLEKSTRDFILQRLNSSLKKFVDQYKDAKLTDNEIDSIDALHIFEDIFPEMQEKSYFLAEKLPLHIAPYFNAKNASDSTDVDYLIKFICSANNAIGKKLNLEQSVDSLVCQFICESVTQYLKNSPKG